MKILIYFFETYGNNFSVPECVKNEAKDYIGDNNIIKEFMEANYENTTDENDTILLHDVWADYRVNRTYFDQFPLRQSQQLSQKLKI